MGKDKADCSLVLPVVAMGSVPHIVRRASFSQRATPFSLPLRWNPASVLEFLEVKPPSTVAFERQLAVHAAARRSIRAIAMLHRSVVAGTPPGPNRDSSPSLVPWLLRCHIYSDTSCLPPFLKFGEQVLNQYGPAQVGFGYHFW